MIYDLHMHLGEGAEADPLCDWLRSEPPYVAAPTAVSYEEAEALFTRISADPLLQKHLIPCAGLHPWQAEQGREAVDRLLPYLLRGPWIGEIGLDKPWCDVPYAQQLEVFRYQLGLAAKHRRPVLIHSKGYEEAVLRELRDFPETIIIHWYSCQDSELLDRFIARGVYFTLGPDNGQTNDTRSVWERVPLDRLLLETDGLGAIAWAEGHNDPLPPERLLSSLDERVTQLAALRQCSEPELREQIRQTSLRLLHQ